MPSNTSRLALPYPLSTDSPNGPAQVEAIANALDPLVTAYASGTAAARPATPTTGAGTLYLATDTLVISFYNGSAWESLGSGSLASGVLQGITTASTWQTIATYTPTASGLFTAQAYATIPGGGATFGVQVTYADAAGAETLTILTPQSQAAGPWSSLSALFYAITGTAINVQVQSSSTSTIASATIGGA